MDDEVKSTIEEECKFAIINTESPFDIAISKQPRKLTIKPNLITYKVESGTIYAIQLKKEDSFSQALFSALSAGIGSEWFENLSEVTKPTYILEVRKFIQWLNQTNQKDIESNRYGLFKSYEAYTINEKGRKESGLRCLNKIVREGISCPELTNADIRFLHKLLRNSKPVKVYNKDVFTLTEWFSLTWLRPILGDDTYLQLESPRRLLLSFRVTIATTLLHLLKTRTKWQKSNLQVFNPNHKNWQYDWNRTLLKQLGNFDTSGLPADELTELLHQDLVKRLHQTYLKDIFSTFSSGHPSLNKKYTRNNTTFCPWQKPIFFHPEYNHQYSPIEEKLAAWLIACEAIQPLDIQKLKTTDYAVELSASGRLLALECNYYKGRSGTRKQPAILLAKDSWTQALHLYIQGLPKSTPLFRSRVDQSKNMPGLGNYSTRHNFLTFLMRIWRLSSLQNKIHAELQRAGASPLFLKAILALEHGDEPHDQFRNRKNGSSEEYRSSSINPLPSCIFSLTHIKNTAVHAGTDKYRDCDLINHHSHTSSTEKQSYLTDANKDFVNRAGRVTRIVLHDLQNSVYQPSVTDIQQSVHDKSIRTRIIETTGVLDVKVYTLSQQVNENDINKDIIVPDNTENALVFIHYINESERMLSKLLAVRPDWVERTLIVQVEWMTRTLSRMRFTKAAQSLYASIGPYLPPLFDHLLETIE